MRDPVPARCPRQAPCPAIAGHHLGHAAAVAALAAAAVLAAVIIVAVIAELTGHRWAPAVPEPGAPPQ